MQVAFSENDFLDNSQGSISHTDVNVGIFSLDVVSCMLRSLHFVIEPNDWVTVRGEFTAQCHVRQCDRDQQRDRVKREVNLQLEATVKCEQPTSRRNATATARADNLDLRARRARRYKTFSASVLARLVVSLEDVNAKQEHDMSESTDLFQIWKILGK